MPNQKAGPTFSAVTSDSRQAGPGVLFVAVRGGTQDGHAFVPQALAAGSPAAIVEAGAPLPPGIDPARLIVVPDSRLTLAEEASRVFGHPSRAMKVFGVTGTSGKTTTAFLLESILKASGLRTGLIGTVVFRYEGKTLPSTHTTPGPVELQKLLAEMRDQGCQAVVMEVSSHALKQHRAAFVAFDGMVFTNLSPEHLDYHPSMEDYFSSKAMLFGELAQRSVEAGKRPFGAVHSDDEWGQRLLSGLSRAGIPDFRFQGFGLSEEADFSGRGLQTDLEGIRGVVAGVKVESALTGNFNAQNILGAACVALGAGISREAVARGLADLKCVPGRLEAVADPDGGRRVLVDYAHKPDALEKVLNALRRIEGRGRLITVFGCGGDRDREKRPKMGEIATRLSDRTFITSDNPRTEDPASIIRMILQGIPEGRNFEVQADRRLAIHEAIRASGRNDIVLIAGKGHEDYQIVGTSKIHFDDREVAAEALAIY